MYKIICISTIEFDQDIYLVTSHKTFRQAKHALCNFLKKERHFWASMLDQQELSEIKLQKNNRQVYASYRIDHLDRDYFFIIVNDKQFDCTPKAIWQSTDRVCRMIFNNQKTVEENYNYDIIPVPDIPHITHTQSCQKSAYDNTAFECPF